MNHEQPQPPETPVDRYAKERAKPVEHLECCCCGRAFKGRQWWNQDTGFGLGDCCAIKHGVDLVVGYSNSYGVAGIHYLLNPQPPVEQLTSFLGTDELRFYAETEIENNRNPEYWQRVLNAI